MRLINVIFLALVAFVITSVGYLYINNHWIMSQEISLWGHTTIKISTLLIGTFLLGFILNLLYTGVMELRRLMRGVSISAANLAGKCISSLLVEAKELLAHSMYDKALKVLETLLNECSDHEEANFLMGDTLLKLNEYDKAIHHLENAYSKWSHNTELKYLLVDALLAANNHDRAVVVLQTISCDYPTCALKALRKLRDIYSSNDQWEDAWDIQKRIVSRFSDSIPQSEINYTIGFLYQVGLDKVESDYFKEAAQIFQQILKDDKTFVPAYLSLGRCMILQDQENQGIEIWLEGFRTTGEGALLQEIEDYFIQSGKPDEGLSLLRKISAISEHVVTAKFFLGKMLYRLEILDEACALFEDVRLQAMDSPILNFFIAKIHARRGRLEKALSEYRQLLRNTGVLRLRFECSICGNKTSDYNDRCDACNNWNSIRFLFKESEVCDQSIKSDSNLWFDS